MLAAAPVLAGCIGQEAKLTGTDLRKEPAPDFELIDYRGEPVRLSDLRGTTVVMAFIFTNCPDVCPETALKFRATYDLLSSSLRDKVSFLAITVDPERDTPEALAAFSERFDLASVPRWHALYADRSVLEPVWASYGIDPGVAREEVESHVSGSGRPYLLRHTDAIYVIDPDGRKRVLMHSDLEPKDLAANIKTLSS